MATRRNRRTRVKHRRRSTRRHSYGRKFYGGGEIVNNVVSAARTKFAKDIEKVGALSKVVDELSSKVSGTANEEHLAGIRDVLGKEIRDLNNEVEKFARREIESQISRNPNVNMDMLEQKSETAIASAQTKLEGAVAGFGDDGEKDVLAVEEVISDANKAVEKTQTSNRGRNVLIGVAAAAAVATVVGIAIGKDGRGTVVKSVKDAYKTVLKHPRVRGLLDKIFGPSNALVPIGRARTPADYIPVTRGMPSLRLDTTPTPALNPLYPTNFTKKMSKALVSFGPKTIPYSLEPNYSFNVTSKMLPP
jgi:hypothetical protein